MRREEVHIIARYINTETGQVQIRSQSEAVCTASVSVVLLRGNSVLLHSQQHEKLNRRWSLFQRGLYDGQVLHEVVASELSQRLGLDISGDMLRRFESKNAFIIIAICDDLIEGVRRVELAYGLQIEYLPDIIAHDDTIFRFCTKPSELGALINHRGVPEYMRMLQNIAAAHAWGLIGWSTADLLKQIEEAEVV